MAKTVIGTPYYMSPEVCESLPYTMKSDVWALGCVLYELCALERPFVADNLLGLVYKIVKSTPLPIPDHLSTEMKEIVEILLNKNVEERPTIVELLKMPYARTKMEEFISKGGLSSSRRIRVKKILKNPQTEMKHPVSLSKQLTEDSSNYHSSQKTLNFDPKIEKTNSMQEIGRSTYLKSDGK